MVGRRKLPDPSLNCIFNAVSFGVQYTLSFQWTNFGLQWLFYRIIRKWFFHLRFYKYQESRELLVEHEKWRVNLYGTLQIKKLFLWYFANKKVVSGRFTTSYSNELFIDRSKLAQYYFRKQIIKGVYRIAMIPWTNIYIYIYIYIQSNDYYYIT